MSRSRFAVALRVIEKGSGLDSANRAYSSASSDVPASGYLESEGFVLSDKTLLQLEHSSATPGAPAHLPTSNDGEVVTVVVVDQHRQSLISPRQFRCR